MGDKEYKSEFGKGLVICLVKLAEHFMEYRHQLDKYEQMRVESPDLFKESSAISSWANGASDHLYEIEVPDGKEWDEIRDKVEVLKSKGLDMGHGKGLMGEHNYSKDDVSELFNLTREIALMVDTKLGLSPELGEW